LFLGTTSGVLRLDDGALERLGLDGHSVTALDASDGVLLAGTYGDGLFRSADGGRTWARIEAGLTASTFRFVTSELAGTEPARVYRSADRGESWSEFEGVTRIPGHERWYLPYSPRAGAARNAYVVGDRVLVAAEVAGLLRSADAARRAARRNRALGRRRPDLGEGRDRLHAGDDRPAGATRSAPCRSGAPRRPGRADRRLDRRGR
jgi:hypothetical protein